MDQAQAAESYRIKANQADHCAPVCKSDVEKSGWQDFARQYRLLAAEAQRGFGWSSGIQ